MEYEWDHDKSDSNLRNRGFGFEIMESFDWSLAICTDIQSVDYEERELWVGLADDGIYAVVITERNSKTRIISLRTATQSEVFKWRREFQNG